MKRLVLIRHGESEWNREHRIQGQAGTGLSGLGRAQADATASWIAANYPNASLHVSDLQRCVETAAPLASASMVEPVLDPGLRERDFGSWTGKLVHEVAEQDTAMWDRWRSGDDVVGDLGGEGTEEFSERIVTTLERIRDEAAEGDTCVCVTHGGPVWHGIRGLFDLNRTVLGGVANGSITEVITDVAFGTRLIAWNQVSHLPPELQTWNPAAVGQRRAPAPPVGE